jgi:hypothetical protein
MIYGRRRSSCYLSVALAFILVLFTLLCNTKLALAQPSAATSASSNFLTYTNTDLGFTMKYPSDWTVDDSKIAINSVGFKSPDGVGIVVVGIVNVGPNETGALSTQNLTKGISSPGVRVIETNTNDYFLSGHPAHRVILIGGFGGPGEPGASQGIEPHDVKMMVIAANVSGKGYSVGYLSPPERFNDNLQTAQTMIESFQIISKQ